MKKCSYIFLIYLVSLIVIGCIFGNYNSGFVICSIIWNVTFVYILNKKLYNSGDMSSDPDSTGSISELQMNNARLKTAEDTCQNKEYLFQKLICEIRNNKIMIILLIILSFFLSMTCLNLRYRNIDYTITESSITLFLIISNFSSIFIAPVAEEFIFRKVFIDEINRQHSVTFAIIISTFTFSVIHWIPDLFFILEITLTPLLYAIIYVKTRKLIYTIVMHSAHNATVFFSEQADNLRLFLENRYLFIYIIAVCVCLFFIILLNKTKKTWMI